MTQAERKWRGRNPELAKRFDRLPATARHNIRTNLFGAGTANLVRTADALRREKERSRSARRRLVKRYADGLASLPSSQRRDPANRPVDLTPSEMRVMWEEYDRKRGNRLHGR